MKSDNQQKNLKAEVAKAPAKVIAKKDHVLFCPPLVDPAVELKRGMEIPGDLLTRFSKTLKTEGVI